jgi:glycosyltransferase involved in cell wall biosynthesis
MRIIYPVPEILPDLRARFIQIVNTCYALAEIGIETLLIAGIKKGYSEEEMFKFYGIPRHPNLKFIRFPLLRMKQPKHIRFSWHGVFHISLLLHLLFIKPCKKEHTILFLRHIKLADFIMKFRLVLKIPIIFEVHEIFHLSTTGRKRKKIRDIEYRVYNKVDAIVSISESIKNYLFHMGISNRPIYTIPDGVRKEWFDINKPTSSSYICYTGSLYLWKGVDTLISAMKYLPNENLLIAGAGSRLEELKNLARIEGTSDRVKFAGAVPHTSIPKYLSQAKIAVLPNLPHGPSMFSSPLKLFEYMACGIPIVASDIPIFHEILTEGENAIFFKPSNPESLATCLKKLIDNPELAARIASNAKEKAKNHTYEKRAKNILKIIKDLGIKNKTPFNSSDNIFSYK